MSVLTGLLTLLSCTAYRTYPLLRLETPEGRLEWTGAAQLPGGALVFSAEGDARALYRPAQAGEPEGGLLDRLVLEDGGCGRADGRAGGQNCQDYRAHTPLLPEPIRWREQGGRLEIPYDLSDLAPFGPERVLAVTGYTAVGRRTGARRDYLVRSRQRTERLAVLERRSGAWEELDDPWVAELQARLSDWGRGTCQDDMLVEGLAWSPEAERVFIGLRRCSGPAAAVLQYDLGAARRGEAVDLERIAEGISGGQGPEEGVSGLCFRDGRLFALSAWDSWGYASEQVYGGRLHEVAGGALQPIRLAEPFVDRPSALAIRAIRPESDGSGPGLDALILFDPDGAPDTPRRPDATLLRPRTLRPEAGRSVALQRLDALTLPLALGLNGFDFRWYARDHRLSQLALQLTAPPAALPAVPPGAWTYAVGGLWQMTVGATAGLISASLPGSPSWAGHNRQAVALTDYGDVPELRLSRWRATLSVVPRERAVRDPSVARLMRDTRADFEVRLPLPPGADPEAGVILQGFSIDTSARAARGICLAAMDLGVERQGRELVLRAMLVGGLCNDFDLRGKELRHGRTTDPAGGVSVTLDYALTAGLPASSWSVTVEDRQVPQAGEGTGGTAASRTMDDHMSRAHLHCAGIYPPGSVEVMTLPAPAPPADWVDVATELRGDPSPPAASLHGFAFAFDPSGFAEEPSAPRTQADILRRNHYLYRYLLRAFPGAPGSPGLVEGGLSHGIHRRGLMRDAALPTALYLRADLTGFPTDRARLYDIPRDRPDPNLLPEDGFVRRAATVALQRPLQCSPWR